MPLTTEEKFQEFHKANPQVYRELLRLANSAKSKGRKKIGIRMLWEVTRWNLTVETNDLNSKFKMNDHYHSRYARLLMDENPHLTGVFELRQLKSV